MRNIEREKQNEILAVYQTGIKLPEFQPSYKQRNEFDKIRKSESALRYSGMYAERFVRRLSQYVKLLILLV